MAGWTATSAPDGRLRGAWTGCDGAAGRMTASAGLHNLPAELRPAVAAEPGHVLVRADLGQVEPRVLAAVSGDRALATGPTADPDLYAPVAARLGVERPVAKVAVLAAMYGQTSGAAGEALRGLERAYPVAMAYLRAADERGRRGERRAHLRRPPGADVAARRPADPPPAVAARGRFARNAVVQGAAAELFKMWAVSVRAALPDGRARSCCACTTSCWCTCRRPTRREVERVAARGARPDGGALGGRQRRALRRRRGHRPALVGRQGLSRT